MSKDSTEDFEKFRTIVAQLDTKYIPKLERVTADAIGKKTMLGTLHSVVLGLYDELDKLCKKSPAEPLTDLALQQVNDAIQEAHALDQEDLHLQKIKPFV